MSVEKELKSQSLLNEVKYSNIGNGLKVQALVGKSQSLLNEVKFPTESIVSVRRQAGESQSLLNEVKFPTFI